MKADVWMNGFLEHCDKVRDVRGEVRTVGVVNDMHRGVDAIGLEVAIEEAIGFERSLA